MHSAIIVLLLLLYILLGMLAACFLAYITDYQPQFGDEFYLMACMLAWPLVLVFIILYYTIQFFRKEGKH